MKGCNPHLAEVVAESPVDKFQPIGDFLLVEPIRRGQTAGGLAIPDDADPEPLRGKVLKAGPGRVTEYGQLIEMPVKVGDTIYLKPILAPNVEGDSACPSIPSGPARSQ